MPEWLDRLRENWPSGSKERALGGKSALQALNEALRKPENPVAQVNDQDLALLLANQIISEMRRLGVSPAAGKNNRESNSSLSPVKRDIRI